jgi:hypothetical protein
MTGEKTDWAIGAIVLAFGAFFVWKFWSNEQKTEQFLSELGTSIGETIHGADLTVQNTVGSVTRPFLCLLNPNQPMCNINDPGLPIIPQTTVDYNPIDTPIPVSGGSNNPQQIVGSAPWYHPAAAAATNPAVPNDTWVTLVEHTMTPDQIADQIRLANGGNYDMLGLIDAPPVYGIVDTGQVTGMGSQIMTDTSNGQMVLRSGIVDITGGLAVRTANCENGGGYMSYSNGKCYNTLQEYCAKYPGLDMCRGLVF